MFFKKCDVISPPITLYFKRYPIHSSIFSGILSIISYTLILCYGIYKIILYINKANPNIYYYTKFIEDAGIFPLNSSSLFHFIQLGNTKNIKDNKNLDFDAIRIFGFEYSIDNYISNNDLSKYNHWLYGPCNNNDVKNIEELIIQEFPEKSACIRGYFSVENQKYYNNSDKNFKWPALLYGCSNDNSVNYGIIIEKCKNDSLKNNCKSELEIETYILNSFAILYFVDNYAEVLNYKNPYVKYLYKLTNGFFSNSFTVNNLNFNPTNINSSNGVFITHKHSQKSFQFTQNEKTVGENTKNTNIIVSFYFWMQNSLLFYDRNYEKFQDLLSVIGGLESFVKFIASLINYLMINYIILLDTEEIVLDIDKQNYRNVNLSQKPSLLKKADYVLNPPKLKLNKFFNKNYNKQNSSGFQILLKNKSNLSKFSKVNNIDSKSESNKKIYFKKNTELNLNNNKLNKNVNNNSLPVNTIIENYKRQNSSKNYNDSKSISLSMRKKNSKMISEIRSKEELILQPLAKQNFSWHNYFFYIITCKLKNPKIRYYEYFRKKVISEENLIQNYINIFKLLKVCKIEFFEPFTKKYKSE